MNTEFNKSNLKDNIAAATVLTGILVAIFGTLVNSPDARADHTAVQQMDTIVINAARTEIAKMDTIVVTATREAKEMVASN